MSKTVLITGCSSGFGLAMVQTFLNAGWQVIATARHPENNTFLQQLQQPALTTLQLDVTNTEDRNKLQIFISEKLNNQLHCLINNAGVGYIGLFEEFSENEIREQFEVNLIGLILITQLCLPALRQSKGKIINISSALGFFGAPMYSIYVASKYAVEGLSESLFYELLSHDVQVALIEPGSIKTKFDTNVKLASNKVNDTTYLKQNANLANMRKKLDKHLSNTTPNDVARTALRLANAKNMPLRTLVGNDAKSIARLRKLLPEFLFIKLVRNFLGKLYS